MKRRPARDPWEYRLCHDFGEVLAAVNDDGADRGVILEERLSEWVDADATIDATDPGELVVRVADRGLPMFYPFTMAELQIAVEEWGSDLFNDDND